MSLRVSLRCAVGCMVGYVMAASVPASAAPFTPGNLVVCRAGTGTTTLNSTVTEAFLDEYTTEGVRVQSIAMPTTVNGIHHRLTITGNGLMDGQVQLSANGQYLTVSGYDAPLGTENVYTTTAVAVNRVVARVSLDGTIDTSTSLYNVYGNSSTTASMRGAITTDGTDLWVAGMGVTPDTSGLRAVTLGLPGTTLTNPQYRSDLRYTEIYDGQLWVSGPQISGILKFGTDLQRTANQTVTKLPDANNHFQSLRGFLLVDLNEEVGFLGTALDTIYGCDSTANFIYKLTWNGTDFDFSGYIRVIAPYGMTGRARADGSVELFIVADNAAAADTIVRITDSTGFGQRFDGPETPVVVIATADARTAFRGIDFIPEPGLASVLALGACGLLARPSRRRAVR